MSDYIEDVFGEAGALAREFVGYQPRAGQVALARAVDAAIGGRKHLFAEAPTGCHAAGQGILMFDGSIKAVEDVVEGDKLMGPDNEPRIVLSLARGKQEMVDVVPVKGTTWRVNIDHILTLVRTEEGLTNRRKSHGGETVDVTVREVLNWSKNKRHMHKLFRASADFSKTLRSFKLKPYFLGMLLGDGSLSHENSIQITTTDFELVYEIRKTAKSFGLRVTRSDRHAYGIVGAIGAKKHPIMAELRKLGLYPIACHLRFVPELYKTADRNTRLEVLAGLMDTDGSLDESSVSGFDYVSKSLQLANDVAFIARSLGLAAYVKSSMKTCQGFGWRRKYFRVHISGETSIIPCRIFRKNAPKRRQIKNVLRTGFQLIPTGESEKYFGFSLDRDGRYLLDDFTVTHNTGKSLAYSVPAIYHATHGAERAVLVTSNIALQEQLVRKDLPLLAKILPWKFEFSLLKGISNYLCIDKSTKMIKRALPLLKDEAKIVEWAATTQTGDKSELSFEPEKRIWEGFSTTSDDCEGSDCQYYEQCHAKVAQGKANNAQIVVVNYNMLFAHMKVLELTNEEVNILPPFDVAVLDEGHKAADIARDCFDVKIGPGSFRWIANKLVKGSLTMDLERESDHFFQNLLTYRSSSKYKIRLKEKNCVSWEGLKTAIQNVMQSYQQTLNALTRDGRDSPEKRKEIRQLTKRCNRAADVILQIDDAMNLKGDDVYFIEENKGYVTLCSKPVNVADRLRVHLFSDKKSTSVTSATLMAANSFKFVMDDLGAVAAQTLVAESPFNWQKQAALILPVKGVPDNPNSPDFPEAVGKICAQVVEQARGRTLALFTSNRNMNAAYPHLLKTGYRILRQGDMPRTQLIEEFKRDVNSVLMGVESFWAGVDVPGESLSCVFIDKLPFVTPDNPIVDAVSERDPAGWFMKYSLPRAIIAFKQGFGRLIRTTTDRGVVVVLDRRITTKRYGQQFIDSLPPVARGHCVEDVRNFLDHGLLVPQIPSAPAGRSFFDLV